MWLYVDGTFSLFYVGGSLAKIAYISEEDARPKHCNENGSIITPDASSSYGVFGVENGAEEQVSSVTVKFHI